MLEGGREKFLVFAHHKLVLDHITTELGKKVSKMYRYNAAHKPCMQSNIIWLQKENFLTFSTRPALSWELKSTLRSRLISVCREQVWAALSTFELSTATMCLIITAGFTRNGCLVILLNVVTCYPNLVCGTTHRLFFNFFFYRMSTTSVSMGPLRLLSGSSCARGSSSWPRAVSLCCPSLQLIWVSPCTLPTWWSSQSFSGTLG